MKLTPSTIQSLFSNKTFTVPIDDGSSLNITVSPMLQTGDLDLPLGGALPLRHIGSRNCLAHSEVSLSPWCDIVSIDTIYRLVAVLQLRSLERRAN